MLIHEFIVNTLQEVRRGLESSGETSTTVDLDFPVEIVLSRSQPGQHSLHVPEELPVASNLARVHLAVTVQRRSV